MPSKRDNNETDETDESSEKLGKPFGHQVWVDKARWAKMQLLKDELGNWNRFADIACEQLLASGLISEESRKAIVAISEEHELDYLDDSAWRDTFEIREPAGKTRSNIRKIGEELAGINGNLVQLVQGVEDHAMAMTESDIGVSNSD